MSENNQLAERPQSVKDYLALPSYRDRFHEVMGKRANQFMAAIVASSNLPGLKDAEPRSVIAAAMVAATLDLPVNPTLGQAHIVAYKDNTGTSVAQFQIGYKGLIQLALRSGQYRRLNAGPVSSGVFTGFDMVGEPILDFTKNDPLANAEGYYCAFETLNGFMKVVYWSKVQAEAHAKRFSRAYAKGYSTPWKSDFDAMAVKTVIKAALGKWGLLSVEMQKAVVHDQGAQIDVDSDVSYVDNDDTGEQPKQVTPRAEPPKRSTRGAASVKENAAIDVTSTSEPKNVTPPAETAAPAPAAAAPESAPAPAAAPAPTPAEAPKTTTHAPRAAKNEKIVQRSSLQDKEVVTVTCTVNEFKTLEITKSGAVHQSVTAQVSGPEFKGNVFHLGGATLNGDKRDANPAWQLDKPVSLTLRGEFSAKQNRVVTWVEKIELPGATAASQQAAVDV